MRWWSLAKPAAEQLSPRTVSRLEREYRNGLQHNINWIEDMATVHDTPRKAAPRGLVVPAGYVDADGCMQPLTQGKPTLTNIDGDGNLSELQPITTPGQRALAADCLAMDAPEPEPSDPQGPVAPDAQLYAGGCAGGASSVEVDA